jgi:uncharacterized membrane protein
MENSDKKTESPLGLDSNISAALSYLFGFISGIFFLLLEKDNKFVKFHAIQSIIISICIFFILIPFSILNMLLPSILNLLLSCFLMLFLLAAFVMYLILMYKAYKNEQFKLPILGDIAETLSKKNHF